MEKERDPKTEIAATAPKTMLLMATEISHSVRITPLRGRLVDVTLQSIFSHQGCHLPLALQTACVPGQRRRDQAHVRAVALRQWRVGDRDRALVSHTRARSAKQAAETRRSVGNDRVCRNKAGLRNFVPGI